MIEAYADAAVSGVPLLFVVIGLVQYIKAFKNKAGEQLVDGNWLLIASMILGFGLGGSFMITQTQPPEESVLRDLFGYWFAVGIYGIGLGIIASGFYDATKAILEKLMVKIVRNINANRWDE